MKDEIKNIVLYEKLKEIYNTMMIKRYHDSYEDINTEIPDDKRYIIDSYNTIVERTANFISSNGFNNVISATTAFEYLLWNGYLSYDKNFVFDTKTKKYNYKDLYGMDVILGSGACLNISSLQRDIFRKLGYDSHIITSEMNGIVDVIYRPNIKRNMNGEINLKQEEVFDNNTHKLNFKSTGNNVLTLVGDGNCNMIVDPTNLEMYYFDGVLNIKNYFTQYEKKDILVPHSLLFLEKMKRDDFHKKLKQLVCQTDDKEIVDEMRNQIPVISNKTVEKLDSMKKELNELYSDNIFSIETIYNALSSDEKPFDKVLKK